MRVRRQRSCSGVLAAVYPVRRERRPLGHGSFRLRALAAATTATAKAVMYSTRWRPDARSELECSASVSLCAVDSGLVHDRCKRTNSLYDVRRRWVDRNRARKQRGFVDKRGRVTSSKAKVTKSKSSAGDERECYLLPARGWAPLLVGSNRNPSLSGGSLRCPPPRSAPTAWHLGLPQSGPTHPADN